MICQELEPTDIFIVPAPQKYDKLIGGCSSSSSKTGQPHNSGSGFSSPALIENMNDS